MNPIAGTVRNTFTSHSIITLLSAALIVTLSSPREARSEYTEINGNPADVVIGTQTYTISSAGVYPAPSPGAACAAAAAAGQFYTSTITGFAYWNYNGLTDLGGSDVFLYGTTPYYHNYACEVSRPGNEFTPIIYSSYNMSRDNTVQCPITPQPGYTAYQTTRVGWYQFVPPLPVDSCISFAPPTITIDHTKKTPPSSCVGNPIYPGTGNKSQIENDYTGGGDFPLAFTRIYNSSAALGAGWRHSYNRTVREVKSLTTTSMKIARGDGGEWTFRILNGYWVSDSDVNARLSGLMTTGWTLITGNDEIETYSGPGKLLSIRNRAGLVQTMTYSDASTPATIAPVAGLLISVSDSFGRQLN